MTAEEQLHSEKIERLVLAAQSGDQQAFAEIVEVTSPAIFALCFRLSGNEHDARDIMQDTYLRVYRSLGSFRSQSSLMTWIYRIAANCASTHLAKRQRRDLTVSELDESSVGNLAGSDREFDPVLVSESSEERGRLVRELERLPFSLRSVIVLGDVYDLPHEEIARELQISRAAVKVRLHRARRRLYEALFIDETEITNQPAGDLRALRSSRTIRGRRLSERDRSA